MMAGGLPGVVIKIGAETSAAITDIHRADRALEGMGDSGGGAMSKISSMAGPALGALSVVGGAAIGAAGAMIAFGQAAWEDQQEAKRLASVLETIPGITREMIDANEDWITTTMFATHVVDTDLRQGISNLVLVTQDLGKAQEYAAAAADLATVTDIEYSAAVEAVQDALVGKTRSLMDLAPQLDTNRDGTLSLAEAQGVLTDATLAGQAEAAAAEDPWTTLKLLWDEVSESLGAWLVPLMTELADWFKDPVNQAKLQEYLNRIAEWSRLLGEWLLPKLQQLMRWITSEEGQRQLSEWAGALQAVASACLAVARGIERVIGWWDKVPDELKTSSGWRLGGPAFGPGSPIWNSSAAPAAAAAGATGPAVTGAGVVIVNNFHVPTDPESTAREMRRVLDESIVRNGRLRADRRTA